MDTSVQGQQGRQKHPPGLYLLFLTEMWERFSYYGMRALLTLYLTTALVSGGLEFQKTTAMSLYGFFTGAVYFTPLAGGYLSDRFLGRRLAITIGGIAMALGNFMLFAQHNKFGLYTGLAFLIIGNGFFKPNISTLVGELYTDQDKRKDAAFTIFYMGINVGGFFAPLVCGYLAEDLFKTTANGVVQYGYRYGFLAAAIGMVIGQILFNAWETAIWATSAKSQSGNRRTRWQLQQPEHHCRKRISSEQQSSLSSPALSSFSGLVLSRREAL